MRALAIAGVIASLASSPAAACSIVYGEMGPAEMRGHVARYLERAGAIIDGEVVRAGSDEEPALVYAHRVFKGPEGQRWYRVGGTNDSCEWNLGRPGERFRMILIQWPDDPRQDAWHIYAFPDSPYTREEDRQLGSNRRRDYPYFAGPRP
jgi:hypothetical protein